jgi:hypothetical protein
MTDEATVDFVPGRKIGFARRMATIAATGLLESMTLGALLDKIVEIRF